MVLNWVVRVGLLDVLRSAEGDEASHRAGVREKSLSGAGNSHSKGPKAKACLPRVKGIKECTVPEESGAEIMEDHVI